MEHYRKQAHKDHSSKVSKFGDGGGLHHPNPMMGMPAMGGKAHGGKAHSDVKEDKALVRKMVEPSALTGKARGGKAHKPRQPKPGPSAETLLARPVPAQGPAVGAMGERPAAGVPAGLQPLKHGGRAHHHMTAGAESGVGRLQKIGRKP